MLESKSRLAISLSLIMFASTSIIGCASMLKTRTDFEEDAKREHELNMVRTLCSPQALVGTRSGFTASINAKREELENLKADVAFEKYSRLSQELTGYSVQWETLNQQVKIACDQHAICLARDSNTGICSDADTKYQNKVKEANDFVLKINTLKLAKE